MHRYRTLLDLPDDVLLMVQDLLLPPQKVLFALTHRHIYALSMNRLSGEKLLSLCPQNGRLIPLNSRSQFSNLMLELMFWIDKRPMGELLLNKNGQRHETWATDRSVVFDRMCEEFWHAFDVQHDTWRVRMSRKWQQRRNQMRVERERAAGIEFVREVIILEPEGCRKQETMVIKDNNGPCSYEGLDGARSLSRTTLVID